MSARPTSSSKPKATAASNFYTQRSYYPPLSHERGMPVPRTGRPMMEAPLNYANRPFTHDMMIRPRGYEVPYSPYTPTFHPGSVHYPPSTGFKIPYIPYVKDVEVPVPTHMPSHYAPQNLQPYVRGFEAASECVAGATLATVGSHNLAKSIGFL